MLTSGKHPPSPIFYKIQIIIAIIAKKKKRKKKAKKQKLKEMYTGAPEKCLEVFALTRKKGKKKKSCQTPLSKTIQVHPVKIIKTKNKTITYIINNYNFTIF